MTTIVFFLPFLILFVVFGIYVERKLSAFIQDRYGPMEVGKYGLLQTVADLLKLIQKEDIVPKKADRKIFLMAPVFIFMVVFSAFSFIPLSPLWYMESPNTGIYLLMAILSIDVIGIVMAGISSNNKFAQLGVIRSISQLIAYEIPLMLSVLSVIVVTHTLDLQEICYQQSIWSSNFETDSESFSIFTYLFDSSPTIGGFLNWNVVKQPLLLLVFVIYFIASLALCNRAPFDLAEAESELVAGYQTEYSGFRWSILALSEYSLMLLVSILAVVLFFGGWTSPLPNIGLFKFANWTSGSINGIYSYFIGVFWLISKTLLLVVAQMWVRWTFPRLRVDQVMNLGWKFLMPIALCLLFLCTIFNLLS